MIVIRTWLSQYQNVSILDFTGPKGDADGGDSWSFCQPSDASTPDVQTFNQYHHHQQTNIQLYYRPDTLLVTQPTVSKH